MFGRLPALARLLACAAAALTLAACGADARDPVGPVTPPPGRPPNAYTDAELAYFGEIAFGFEFGSATPVIRRWPGDVRVAVRGAPTDEDRATVAAVMRELTALIGGPVRVVDAAPDAQNLEVHFVPRAQFSAVLPQAVPNNDGQFWVWWDGANHFLRGTVLIGTDVAAVFRQHLIREELTQSLGLARDSPRYPESMFYSGYTSTSAYSALDRALVEMLYREEVRVGMTAAEAMPVLRALTRRTPVVAAAGGVPRARAPRPDGTAGAGAPAVAVGMAGGGSRAW